MAKTDCNVVIQLCIFLLVSWVPLSSSQDYCSQFSQLRSKECCGPNSPVDIIIMVDLSGSDVETFKNVLKSGIIHQSLCELPVSDYSYKLGLMVFAGTALNLFNLTAFGSIEEMLEEFETQVETLLATASFETDIQVSQSNYFNALSLVNTEMFTEEAGMRECIRHPTTEELICNRHLIIFGNGGPNQPIGDVVFSNGGLSQGVVDDLSNKQVTTQILTTGDVSSSVLCFYLSLLYEEYRDRPDDDQTFINNVRCSNAAELEIREVNNETVEGRDTNPLLKLGSSSFAIVFSDIILDNIEICCTTSTLSSVTTTTTSISSTTRTSVTSSTRSTSSTTGTTCVERMVQPDCHICGNDDSLDNKISHLKFLYKGSNCIEACNSQNVLATGDPSNEMVIVVVAFNDKVLNFPLQVGDSFTVPGLEKTSKYSVLQMIVFDSSGKELSTLEIDASCYSPLKLGDEFGAFELINFLTENSFNALFCPPPVPYVPERCEICGTKIGSSKSSAKQGVEYKQAKAKLTSFTLKYTGYNCLENCNEQESKSYVTGDPQGEPKVAIVIEGKKSSYALKLVELDETFTLTSFDNNFILHLFDMSGKLLSTVTLHTSCSVPIAFNDKYGSLTLVGFETTLGVTEDSCPPIYEPNCPQTTTTQPAQNDCLKKSCGICSVGDLEKTKLRSITLEFQGSNCVFDYCNDQPSDKWSVSGNVGLRDNVYIRSTSDAYASHGNIAIGERFTIEDFKSETKVSLFVSQGSSYPLSEITFHTSCSKPLSVNDQFGSLKVVAFETEDGRTDQSCPCATQNSTNLRKEPESLCVGLNKTMRCPVCPSSENVSSITFRYDGYFCSGEMCNEQDVTTYMLMGDLIAHEKADIIHYGQSSIDTIRSVGHGDVFTLKDFSDLAHVQVVPSSDAVFRLPELQEGVSQIRFAALCSAGIINLGDSFGPLTVVGFETSSGRSNSDCAYQVPDCVLTMPAPVTEGFFQVGSGECPIVPGSATNSMKIYAEGWKVCENHCTLTEWCTSYSWTPDSSQPCHLYSGTVITNTDYHEPPLFFDANTCMAKLKGLNRDCFPEARTNCLRGKRRGACRSSQLSCMHTRPRCLLLENDKCNNKNKCFWQAGEDISRCMTCDAATTENECLSGTNCEWKTETRECV
eukprot:m.100759 g.100759  ORF g.100759 m.100759 type:complete len:1147 (-) comp13722_c0_seq2:122-3562(-)